MKIIIENWNNLKIGDIIVRSSLNSQDLSECTSLVQKGYGPYFNCIASLYSTYVPFKWQGSSMYLRRGYYIELIDKKDLILYSFFQAKSPRYWELLK